MGSLTSPDGGPRDSQKAAVGLLAWLAAGADTGKAVVSAGGCGAGVVSAGGFTGPAHPAVQLQVPTEVAADFVRAAPTMAGELQRLARRCRPEILYALILLSQAISKNSKDAVYRRGHLLKYLKRYPEGGIYYTSDPQLTPDARVHSSGVVVEGFCDASFAPNSGRSQQAVMVFMMGGVVAW